MLARRSHLLLAEDDLSGLFRNRLLEALHLLQAAPDGGGIVFGKILFTN